MLQDFSQKISGIMEINRIKGIVLNFFVNEMNLDSSLLLLWLKKDSAVIGLRKKENAEIIGGEIDLSLPEGEIITPQTFLKREKVLEKLGVLEEDFATPQDNLRALYLMLKQEKTIIGILGLVKLKGEIFEESEIKLLSIMARNLSVCFHRAMLYESAITDTLTGFYLRKYFEFTLSKEIERASRYNHRISLMRIELDNFNNLIETYGESVGALAIQQFSAEIKTLFRKTDIVSRFELGEFAILLPEAGYNDSLAISKRIQKRIFLKWLEIPDSNISIKLNISIGISIFPGDGNDAESLLNKAKDALRQAKSVTPPKIIFARDIA